MSTPQFAGDSRPALVGTVQCGNCKGPMLRVGPDYACAAGLARERHPCYENAIDADLLLQLVMDRLVGLVMTRETVDSVVKIISSQTAEASRRERQHLDQTEEALERLQEQEDALNDSRDLVYNPNYETEPPEIDEEELRKVSNTVIALRYESRRSSKELDGLKFVGDSERLRTNALNPENYRHPNHPDYTTRIVRMFIETVEVTPDTISLKFTMPVPTEDEPEGALSTIIPL